VVGSTWPAQPATVRAQAMAPPTDQVIHAFLEHFNAVQSHSNELTKGPPELVQYFFCRGTSYRARALHFINLIWFGYIARLYQWGGRG
jgi:hypothetical protein